MIFFSEQNFFIAYIFLELIESRILKIILFLYQRLYIKKFNCYFKFIIIFTFFSLKNLMILAQKKYFFHENSI